MLLINTILRKIPIHLQLQLINKHHLLPKLTIPTSPSYSMYTSMRLSTLAQQLRHYKPPPPPSSDDDDDVDKESGKVVADVGFAQSSNPIGQNLEVDGEKRRALVPKRAAVLVCIFEGQNGDFRVVLTKRSSKLSTHSGEVALPGGKAEEGDKDDVETAKREAHEEIGLDPSLVNAVTNLEPFLSKHLLKVVPVIGILSDKNAFNPIPNTDEVEAVFDAPLEMFIKDENRRAEEREWMGQKYLIHFFDYKTDEKSYLIWGLTASILIRAASVVYQRELPFSEQNPRFKIPRFTDNNTVMR